MTKGTDASDISTKNTPGSSENTPGIIAKLKGLLFKNPSSQTKTSTEACNHRENDVPAQKNETTATTGMEQLEVEEAEEVKEIASQKEPKYSGWFSMPKC
jgi:hypothetical protein